MILCHQFFFSRQITDQVNHNRFERIQRNNFGIFLFAAYRRQEPGIFIETKFDTLYLTISSKNLSQRYIENLPTPNISAITDSIHHADA